MVSVKVNGQESSLAANELSKIADIIELIKASIDPDHIITGILLNGRDLAEQDWTAHTNQYETCILEIETGRPEEYVTDRLSSAAAIVRSCYIEFRDARKCFQQGDMTKGNQLLVGAVNTAKAFFEWYASLLELATPEKKPEYDITEQVKEITAICKRICQQQLYQSWWALGETLEKELEPKLDKLEDFCGKFTRIN